MGSRAVRERTGHGRRSRSVTRSLSEDLPVGFEMGNKSGGGAGAGGDAPPCRGRRWRERHRGRRGSYRVRRWRASSSSSDALTPRGRSRRKWPLGEQPVRVQRIGGRSFSSPVFGDLTILSYDFLCRTPACDCSAPVAKPVDLSSSRSSMKFRCEVSAAEQAGGLKSLYDEHRFRLRARADPRRRPLARACPPTRARERRRRR